MNSVDGVDLEKFKLFLPSFTFYCSCEGHLCLGDQGDEVAATSEHVAAGLLHLLWCLILLVLWPIRFVSTVAPCAQRLPFFKSFGRVLQSQYFL